MQTQFLPSFYPIPEASEPSYPPFNETKVFCTLTTKEGRVILPHIECTIDRGFFKSSDDVWTMYARNTLSVECSYVLQPEERAERLFLARRGSGSSSVIRTKIWALALCPRLEVFDNGASSVGLYQQTRSRNRGKIEWLPVNKHVLLPSTGSDLARGPTSLPRLDPYAPHTLSDPGKTPPVARPSTHSFNALYLKDAPTNTQRRRQQRMRHFRIIVDLYADIRAKADDTAEWIKIAHRSSVMLSARGRITPI